MFSFAFSCNQLDISNDMAWDQYTHCGSDKIQRNNDRCRFVTRHFVVECFIDRKCITHSLLKRDHRTSTFNVILVHVITPILFGGLVSIFHF